MLSLQHGRTLSIEPARDGEVLEIRGASGSLELRVTLTPAGVVLQVDAARIALRATDAVDIECGTFNVSARDGVAVTSAGAIEIAGQSDVRVESNGDVRVQGEMVYLN